MGITPNIITTTGLILNIAAAAVFIYAGYLAKSEAYFYVGLGGGVVLFAGLFDMLDGRVARLGNMVSRFGAFYDSVLDRYSELFTLSEYSFPYPARVYGVGYRRVCCPYRVYHGKLCPGASRRIGVGVQGGAYAASRTGRTDQPRCSFLRDIRRLYGIRSDSYLCRAACRHCRSGQCYGICAGGALLSVVERQEIIDL